MRTTHSKQTNTSVPSDTSATINTQATHTQATNQRPKKLGSKMLPICFLLVFHPTFP
jgi:hypothetical protein